MGRPNAAAMAAVAAIARRKREIDGKKNSSILNVVKTLKLEVLPGKSVPLGHSLIVVHPEVYKQIQSAEQLEDHEENIRLEDNVKAKIAVENSQLEDHKKANVAEKNIQLNDHIHAKLAELRETFEEISRVNRHHPQPTKPRSAE